MPPLQNTPEGKKDHLLDFIPDDKLCHEVFEEVRARLHPAVLNHSLRVFVYALWLARKQQSIWNDRQLPFLFTACLFHDVGACQEHDSDQRFEIEGADAARRFLCARQSPQDLVHEVWVAIALHTSAGIAERISDLAKFVRQGVLIDFRPATRDELEANDHVANIEQSIPRLDIEKVLGDLVVAQAVRSQHTGKKAPAASWPGILLRSHLENPGWNGVNRSF